MPSAWNVLMVPSGDHAHVISVPHTEEMVSLSLLRLIESECVARLLCSIAVYQVRYSAGNSDLGTVAGLIFFYVLVN